MSILNKNLHIWLHSYLIETVTRPLIPSKPGLKHLMFCLADHFEPYWNSADESTAKNRLDSWTGSYPEIAVNFIDADGMHPRHSFFYPQEEYRREHLDRLADLCRQGFGEVEVHLHHDRDTADGLREKLTSFTRRLRETHGLLPSTRGGNDVRYAFIHGNWALDNSRKDGLWCGVNNELSILKETGCYADMTLPSAPSDTQTSKINSIYYAVDDPVRPKSHNSGHDVRVKGSDNGGLMIIQGPLALNWYARRKKIFPKIENSDISFENPPTPDRIDLWVKQHIHVRGRPEWIFVKVHTHGAQEKNQRILLGKSIEEMHRYLNSRYNDGKEYALHYVTAREMYNIIKAAEDGKDGTPGEYRDYTLIVL